MINYSFHHIAKIINGSLVQSGRDSKIEHLVIDSRRIIFPSTSLFFALTGPRRDGHTFIDEVYQKGVRNFVISKSIEVEHWKDANFVLVSSGLRALQLLAIHRRNEFSYPVIGITGSNGKTIVKEWLNQLLEPNFNIVRSPKSYNSQIGVPLSIWQMNDQDELGIFEAGISMPGEMEHLQKIIQPNIGIFTNIGEAHSEGFKNMRQKIEEKIKLFGQAQTLFYCSDEKPVHEIVKNLFPQPEPQQGLKTIQILSWGRKDASYLRINEIKKEDGISTVEAIVEGRKNTLKIPFTDEASIHNAITCWCVLLFLSIPPEVIQKRILALQHISMRLELKRGINHCTIINDSYSADLSSLNIALDLLNEQRQHSKHTVIISDILQSGLEEDALYTQVAAALEQRGVDRIIGLGEKINLYKKKFSKIPKSSFYHSTSEFIANFREFEFSNEAILLKGARIFAFEVVDRLLAEKLHQTVLEIDLDALAHNLKQYQKLLNPSTKVMAMVKAFAYGSGSYEIANILQFNKVDFLSVAYADEGVELRKAGITIPIMVMNTDENAFPLLSEFILQPVVYSHELLSKLEEFILKEGEEKFPIHIEINSGMNRLGFDPGQVEDIMKKLNTSLFKVISVFSHFAASEDPQHDAFSRNQSEIFLAACRKIEAGLPYSFMKHIANTAAAERFPQWQLDMVRLGIGLYGIDTFQQSALELQQVSTLRSTIAQIRQVSEGDTISYGRQGIASRVSLIATVRVGYADGYPRSLSNGNGRMLVNGQLAPIIGAVCMDMTMIDVTDIPSASEGDEVIVFGKELPVQQVANWASTIPYEILTGVSQRVKRVYFQAG
ncbi:MAG TPA: bifunctional UDP-N-acetylmuramoyl-tripeptide:D-alanyl-D-alanine ligase/alanine racemase [Chitinophagaceae bacterium]|nr:bifunctional UDP-N-acetylmuramoyl-tripeptide:D-alanyl-D-alanine ligase/alanine racemase [Chitinophagaceae bacterium]